MRPNLIIIEQAFVLEGGGSISYSDVGLYSARWPSCITVQRPGLIQDSRRLGEWPLQCVPDSAGPYRPDVVVAFPFHRWSILTP